jgi:hypothetical protein
MLNVLSNRFPYRFIIYSNWSLVFGFPTKKGRSITISLKAG